jgi:hypothetical protein
VMRSCGGVGIAVIIHPEWLAGDGTPPPLFGAAAACRVYAERRISSG